MELKSWGVLTHLFLPQNKRLRTQMLTTIRSQMNEVEIINNFKSYGDKKDRE